MSSFIEQILSEPLVYLFFCFVLVFFISRSTHRPLINGDPNILQPGGSIDPSHKMLNIINYRTIGNNLSGDFYGSGETLIHFKKHDKTLAHLRALVKQIANRCSCSQLFER